jgi:hypothetical protein
MIISEDLGHKTSIQEKRKINILFGKFEGKSAHRRGRRSWKYVIITDRKEIE